MYIRTYMHECCVSWCNVMQCNVCMCILSSMAVGSLGLEVLQCVLLTALCASIASISSSISAATIDSRSACTAARCSLQEWQRSNMGSVWAILNSNTWNYNTCQLGAAAVLLECVLTRPKMVKTNIWSTWTIPNQILASARAKWTKMVYFGKRGPFWSIWVHQPYCSHSWQKSIVPILRPAKRGWQAEGLGAIDFFSCQNSHHFLSWIHPPPFFPFFRPLLVKKGDTILGDFWCSLLPTSPTNPIWETQKPRENDDFSSWSLRSQHWEGAAALTITSKPQRLLANNHDMTTSA